MALKCHKPHNERETYRNTSFASKKVVVKFFSASRTFRHALTNLLCMGTQNLINMYIEKAFIRSITHKSFCDENLNYIIHDIVGYNIKDITLLI